MDREPLGSPGVATTIERGLALIVVGGLLLGILAVLRPFATAILFGSILAIAIWPLRDALVRRGLRAGWAATLLLVMVLVAVVTPLLLIAPGLVATIDSGATWAHEALLSAPSDPPRWLVELPLVGARLDQGWHRLAESRSDLGGLVAPYMTRVQGVVLDVAAALADSGLQIILSLVVAMMLWINGPVIAEALRHGAGRIGGRTGEDSVEAAAGAVRAVAYGVVGTSVAQGILAGIGYAVAGVPAAALLGFLTFVFSISQILGPLVILMWAGAGWWLFSHGHTALSVFMVLWGAIIVSGSDNILRPPTSG